MLAPMALCTAAVMATSCSCSRPLFVAGPTHLLMKRQRQHQRQAVMILTRSMRVAPHQQRRQKPLFLQHHHRPETSSLSPALRATTNRGGSKAVAPLAAAAAASSTAGFGGRGVVTNLRCRGRQGDLSFSTSSRQTEVVVNQSAGDGGSGGRKKTVQKKRRSPLDLSPQQQQQQQQQQQKQQQPIGSTNSQSPDAVEGSSTMAGTGGSSSLVVLATRGEKNGESSTSSRSDDVERCRGLAQNLGVPLLVEGEMEGAAGGAGAETGDFRFTLSFDEAGRLALGQPGSGFKPLAVDFSGGKTGHRAKNQQGTEQVVKAAALPKRRAVAAAASDMDGRQTSSGVSRSSNGNGGQRERDGGLEQGCGDVEEEGPPLLWDLTAGLGTDSFVLALAGWRVEMFERSTVVAAMVQDALDRARAGEDETARIATSRMSLVVGDSTDAAVERAAGQGGGGGGGEGGAAATRRPAVVYLDPMFPQRKKSALVKKGMQMLQALLEEDDGERRGATQQGHGDDGIGGGGGGGSGEREGEERRLFDAAMSVATRKVVVKRPVHGAAIVGHVAPSHTVVSKNGRFDVYVVKQQQ